MHYLYQKQQRFTSTVRLCLGWGCWSYYYYYYYYSMNVCVKSLSLSLSLSLFLHVRVYHTIPHVISTNAVYERLIYLT